MVDEKVGKKAIVIVLDGDYEELAQRIIDGAQLHPLRITAMVRGASLKPGMLNTKVRQAEQFLRDALQSGPVEVQDLIGAALDAGIGSYTLRVAKKRIGAESVKLPGKGSNWTWVMPDPLQ